jgi:hypothetical protein
MPFTHHENDMGNCQKIKRSSACPSAEFKYSISDSLLNEYSINITTISSFLVIIPVLSQYPHNAQRLRHPQQLLCLPLFPRHFAGAQRRCQRLHIGVGRRHRAVEQVEGQGPMEALGQGPNLGNWEWERSVLNTK